MVSLPLCRCDAEAETDGGGNGDGVGGLRLSQQFHVMTKDKVLVTHHTPRPC